MKAGLIGCGRRRRRRFSLLENVTPAIGLAPLGQRIAPGLLTEHGRQEAQSRRHPPSPRSGRDAVARIVRCGVERGRQAVQRRGPRGGGRGAPALVPTVTDRIDSRIPSRAGDQLRSIAQFGAGADNIDVQTAVQRGVTITNTPGVLTGGHRRHDHGADPGRAAPHRRRRESG
ncbi:MAG: hypothetical protein R3C16_12075 [Hyphomonadaceae bacterium]